MTTTTSPSPLTSSSKRPRAPSPPSNTLVLVLPPLFFSEPTLLPLFHLHFQSYGTVVSWTPLPHWERVVAVYQEGEDAEEARDEMDGFVWEDDEGGEDQVPPLPLRVFYGPAFTITHLPASSDHPEQQEQLLLTVPSSGKNFLISPPGSPPVGWQQISEEQPNREVFHPEDGIQPVVLPRGEDGRTKEFSEGWADELTRALRFLSVDSGGGDDDEEGDAPPPPPPPADGDDDGSHQTTQLVLPPLSSTSSLAPRPAVTVSSPPTVLPSSSSLPPSRDISQVKATLESMLGRKRSVSDLRRAASPSRSRSSSFGSTLGEDLLPIGGGVSGTATPALGTGLGGGGIATSRITPTARPPLA